MSEPQEGEALAEGTLISHLLELRDRLVKATIAIGICFAPCAWYMNELFSLIAKPLIDKLPKGASLIATSVVAPFTVPLKLAILVAIAMAMPYVLYQIWAFVAPGLYRHEKRFAVPLLLSSVILFYSGAAFGYFVVFPIMFQFFTMTTPAGVLMMTDMSNYLDFVTLLLFAFGIAFEVPVATVLLVWTGFVKIEHLTENRGYVILAIFIIAAILTPPDAVSQCFMAVPMYILYEAGIVMARILLKDKIAARAREEAQQREHEAGV
jgi:sec-independent protein translocase protein TatC